MNTDRIKDQFSHVYVTIVSVFLGLALEDLYGKFESIDKPGFYAFVILFLVSFLVINSWIAYSSIAISIRVIPIPMDAFTVFGVATGLFLLNSMIFKPTYLFFYMHGLYNLGAALGTVYNMKRALSDEDVNFELNQFQPLYVVNVVIFLLSICIGGILQFNLVSKNIETVLVGLILVCPIIWLWIFWKNYKLVFLD